MRTEKGYKGGEVPWREDRGSQDKCLLLLSSFGLRALAVLAQCTERWPEGSDFGQGYMPGL